MKYTHAIHIMFLCTTSFICTMMEKFVSKEYTDIITPLSKPITNISQQDINNTYRDLNKFIGEGSTENKLQLNNPITEDKKTLWHVVAQISNSNPALNVSDLLNLLNQKSNPFINDPDAHGNTALLYALTVNPDTGIPSCNNPEIVQYLFYCGANPLHENKYGISPKTLLKKLIENEKWRDKKFNDMYASVFAESLNKYTKDNPPSYRLLNNK